MSATYTKLKSGAWGIRISGGTAPTVGAKITVTKKSGETKVETVTKVVWSGNGVHLCVVAGTEAPVRWVYAPGSLHGRRTGCSCGSVEGESRPNDCWTCRHDND